MSKISKGILSNYTYRKISCAILVVGLLGILLLSINLISSIDSVLFPPTIIETGEAPTISYKKQLIIESVFVLALNFIRITMGIMGLKYECNKNQLRLIKTGGIIALLLSIGYLILSILLIAKALPAGVISVILSAVFLFLIGTYFPNPANNG